MLVPAQFGVGGQVYGTVETGLQSLDADVELGTIGLAGHLIELMMEDLNRMLVSG